MAHCTICEKTTRFGNRLSRSLQRSRRKMKPNLQKVGGLVLCTRCLRTLRRTVQAQVEDKLQASTGLASASVEPASASVEPAPVK